MALAGEEVDPHWQLTVNQQLDRFGKQLVAFQETISKRFDVFSAEIASLRRQDDLGTAERQNHAYRLGLVEEAVKASSKMPVQEAIMNQEVAALRKELKRLRKQPEQQQQQHYQQRTLSINQMVAVVTTISVGSAVLFGIINLLVLALTGK